MEEEKFSVYAYRWVILIVFMFLVAMNQLLWITFASITGEAATFYGVSDLSIGMLSLIFMIVYIVMAIPASWAIDTFGIRIAIGIGAVLTGIFGLTRGLFSSNYNLVFISQIGIAIGQPFILNALTTIAAKWFPIKERATASGLGTLAVYLGIIIGLALTPLLTIHFHIGGMLTFYGIISVISAILFIVFAKNSPPTPPCLPGQEERSLVLDGLKNIFHLRNFGLLMIVFFIGLGVFNGVTTWIEDIVRPRHFSAVQAGIIGGLMVVGGLVGAVVIPTLSDRYRKRVPFIIIALAGTIPGLLGITYATDYWLILVSAFFLGFFLLSAGPVGFQYGAEIAYPTPEGTSNGLLIWMGQISGVIFIFAMNSLRAPGTGAMTLPLLLLIGLIVVSLILSFWLKESKLLTESKNQ
jgi:sugar phosphate permease